ncbi:N-alpha-acetyltransferase 15, NatA auxiliary subunit [Xylographa opegraphella]|nr:N-alpha-acetyltransferase 15, NatA auxiliary subunit [Xylographa opegraphella]
MPQPLSSKERTLFTQVVKNYENKQYKKGLKAAEQILRKAPNHGDTQAMKALIMNSQGHSDEAFALAKIALTNDMKSHVCWHVYGLLWRSAKNFEEAIKAYKFALRLEPESQQIQRDLALLQMQMRDYQGYIQSRKAMLQARPALRANWTALAIAHHLAGELTEAERTMTTYEETLKSPPPKTDMEHAEAVLYKNTIIAEMGEIERALEHLDAAAKNSVDKQSVMEMRATYLLRLERKEEAEKVYRALIDRNAELRVYYEGLQSALGLDLSDSTAIKQLYGAYADKNPRGDAARRIPLDFYQGDDFREAADQYLQRMLHKGVPSTFANIKALYKDSSKCNVVQELVESYAAGTHTPQTNGVTDKQTNGSSSLFETSTLYFLAQHYNYYLSRDLPKAMSYIDKAIELSPNSVDLHMTKARIWKHNGNIHKAAETMEYARSLDIRDRYIYTKAAKYHLRNDDHETALETMKKFTKVEAVGGPLGDLHDMQCIWYITEDGESYMRQMRIGLALKRFTAVYNIFEVWQEDQFDFHSFSLRKGQIRAYVDMIRWEDHLRDHPFYSRAAMNAIQCYILLHDNPYLAHGSHPNGVNGNGKLDPNEAKKAAKRARKEKEKQDQVDAEKKDAKKTAGVAGADGEVKKVDTDPQGEKLVQTTEPLKDAMKFLDPLLEFSPKSLEAQRVGFEVFIRRKKYLLAVRCLLAALSTSPSDPIAHYQLIRLQHALSTLADPLSPKVSAVITSEFSSRYPSSKADLEKHNNDFLKEHKDSAQHQLAGLQARQFLDPGTREANEKEVLRMISEESIGMTDAVRALEIVKEWGGDASKVSAKAAERWPEAAIFQVKEKKKP